jgi:transcriptional regulator with XRE-family HTH domain
VSTTFLGIFVAIGTRLREERKRLRMTQATFAERGGIGISTLKLYEADERDPGAAFLAALAEIGVDAQYVVTGRRSTTPMAADEQVLLDGFRAHDPATRRRMLAFVLTESGPAEVSRKIAEVASVTVKASGDGAQAAGGHIVNRGRDGK